MSEQEELTSVVLFINKLDMILPLNRNKIDSIEQAYKPLWDAIRGAFNGYAHYQIMGAAGRGNGISGAIPSAAGDDRTLLEIIVDNAGPVSYTHLTLPTILLV